MNANSDSKILEERLPKKAREESWNEPIAKLALTFADRCFREGQVLDAMGFARYALAEQPNHPEARRRLVEYYSHYLIQGGDTANPFIEKISGEVSLIERGSDYCH